MNAVEVFLTDVDPREVILLLDEVWEDCLEELLMVEVVLDHITEFLDFVLLLIFTALRANSHLLQLSNLALPLIVELLRASELLRHDFLAPLLIAVI